MTNNDWSQPDTVVHPNRQQTAENPSGAPIQHEEVTKTEETPQTDTAGSDTPEQSN